MLKLEIFCQLGAEPSSAYQIELIASKLGYAQASVFINQVFSNQQGAPDINHYHFGMDLKGNPNPLTALTNPPLVLEVISTPLDEIYTNPSTAFTLKFSEPMNYLSVEKNFRLKVFELAQKEDEEILTCIPQNLNRNQTLTTFTKDDFGIHWNSERTIADFIFKVSSKLPTSNYFLIGQISFDEELLDSEGISRKNEFFRLSTERVQNDYWFIVKPLK